VNVAGGVRTGDVGDAAVVDHHEVLPIGVQLVRKPLHLLHSAKINKINNIIVLIN
jgi:hypothetical protein